MRSRDSSHPSTSGLHCDRPFLVAALSEIDEPRRTIQALWPPGTVSEAVVVGGAIVDGGTREEAAAFLALPLVTASTDASLSEIARRVRERRVK